MTEINFRRNFEEEIQERRLWGLGHISTGRKVKNSRKENSGSLFSNAVAYFSCNVLSNNTYFMLLIRGIVKISSPVMP